MTEARGWTSRASGNSSSTSGSDRDEASDFECNICLDLAQDPIITLCGHLYCWPCLYRWLRIHSQSQECPVCKALVLEEKLIPLYGRGKTPTDPRSKPIPGLEIPVRPSGQRPDTATPPPEASNFSNMVMGLMGFMPLASATFGNFGVSAGLFGQVFSPLLSVHFHGFSNANGLFRYHHGYPGSIRDRGRLNPDTSQVAQAADENLRRILFVVIIFVLVAFLFL
ncbi:uncharacterized protein [Primulina huaijiensis]|uniref:uncharacterized protein n=1 Tax=Primulina huaijiensis TaxID=1492673 RepID=UPI003CC721B7